MIDILYIYRESDLVGRLEYNRGQDALSLHYEDSWRFDSNGFPISVSLPLETRSHDKVSVLKFLQGLLPDNSSVLDAWGKRFQGSPRNPFDLIKHVGEDCAGGLQFVRPERIELILSGGLDSLREISDDELEKRLNDLKAQTKAFPVHIEGRFSLAGAQAKDALYRKDGKWFIPEGRLPTTHILKPQPDGLEEHVVHEHLCLRLVHEAGLPSAKSEIMRVGDVKVLCVQRYDRIVDPNDGYVLRLHQEDVCQALGYFPSEKYEHEGGPSAADIARLLRMESSNSEEDLLRFVAALALNWVIYGSDAHSKNYSLIHAGDRFLRLAPIYDVASNLPYEPNPKSTKRKLSMKIGGDYHLHKIGLQNWRKWAAEADQNPEVVELVVRTTINTIEEKIGAVAEEVSKECESDFAYRLSRLIVERVGVCRKAMEQHQ